MSAKKKEGKVDKRSVTSKKNMLKAQQTKAERQRKIKEEIKEFKKEKQKEVKNPKIEQLPEESDSDSSDEEIVIKSRKKAKEVEDTSIRNELSEMKALLKDLTTKKTTVRRTKSKPIPIPQPAPVINIHNPSPLNHKLKLIIQLLMN